MKNQTKEEALEGLLHKYGIAVGEHRDKPLLPGYQLMGQVPEEKGIPLLAWRLNRPFTELRQIVQTSVVEHPCLFRFSCLATRSAWTLEQLVYRETDLCEYISGGKTESVFAVWNGAHSVNLILTLNTGPICSIEISLALPPGTPMQERHEIIGRRGTASDRVVDTQVPQHSVYFFRESGLVRYLDTDMELFGFDGQETEQIRGAFEWFKRPELRAAWADQHQHLQAVVQAAVTSGRKKEKVSVNSIHV